MNAKEPLPNAMAVLCLIASTNVLVKHASPWRYAKAPKSAA